MSDAQAGATVGTDELFPWVEEVVGGRIAAARLASGGNRCQSWLIDVDTDGGPRPVFLRYQPSESGGFGPYSTRREAEFYSALLGTGVPLAQLIATHDRHQAMLMERLDGSSSYLRIKDDLQRAAVAKGAMEALASLHALDPSQLPLPSSGGHMTMEAAVAADLANWWAMYLDTGRTDPLIEFGYAWLRQNLPRLQARPALVHGDAGPGNFMFDGSRFTGLIDWEFAHLGDPMEDLAWFSMRSVLEPVPDFPRRVRDYEAASGAPVDLARIRYHQVFVAWRVVIIRHSNVSGAVGASILTRALNRRLLVEAISEITGVASEPFRPIVPRPDREREEFGRVLDLIRDDIVAASTDERVIAKAKDMARAIKYLRQIHLIGDDVDARERDIIGELLGMPAATLGEGRVELSRRLRAGDVPLEGALRFFREMSGLETQLAADSMGSMAHRHFPKLKD